MSTGQQLKPFTGLDTSRNYRRFYRLACDFHARHTPPTLSDSYWNDVNDDMLEVSSSGGSDPFLIDLLLAVFAELEREYKIAMAMANDAEKKLA